MAYQDRLGKFIKENRIHQTFQPLTNKEKDPMRLFKECRNLQKKTVFSLPNDHYEDESGFSAI